jgi:hypothetical protein
VAGLSELFIAVDELGEVAAETEVAQLEGMLGAIVILP